jgi:serine/threonine protein kinase
MAADEQLISLQPGTVIAGRYEVVKCLGAGSVGLVYACRHRDLPGHLVAVKVLFPEVAQDRVAAARFRNEIIASYGVSNPHVVRAYEYLRDGDLVAYTMEYVDGGALADKIEKGSSHLSIEEIVRLLAQMCAGVQAIHDAGIVHRDLKPENILLTRDGDVKIGDFGIARTGHGPRLTEHGGVVGTIDYVSPEYMLNSQVDWRSDLYALGILAYEMLTGISPFRGDSVYATMTKRLKSDPKRPTELRPECPEQLSTIVLKAMARDPELRYQSAAEIYNDLKEFMPDVVERSRAAMPTGARASGVYVGPAVTPAPADDEVPSVTVTQEQRQASSVQNRRSEEPLTRAPQRADAITGREDQTVYSSQGSKVSSRVRTNDIASDDSFRDSQERLDSFAPPEPAQPRSSYQPQRAPLSAVREAGQQSDYESPVSRRSWIQPKAGEYEQAHGVASGRDEDRMRRLSAMADAQAPSLMGDLLFIVGAALVGVVVGFILVMIFVPDILSKSFSG